MARLSLRALSQAVAVVFLAGAAGCAPPSDSLADDEAEGSDEGALSDGTNGGACVLSPYNCKLRVNGGNAVENAQDGQWGVESADVVDGNGNSMGTNTSGHLRFNYGQTRRMNDRTYVYARSTSLGSSGWFPIDKVKSEDVLRSRIGEVNAHGAGLDKMGCYEVRSSHDANLGELKVVYDSHDSHEKVADYLPLPRANGTRYVNLAFSVPGFALGAPAVDIWPAGTKFRRLRVPTDSGAPSIDIPIYAKDGEGRYRKHHGDLKFIYGYVVSADGTRRNGWMSYPALSVSSGCP